MKWEHKMIKAKEPIAPAQLDKIRDEEGYRMIDSIYNPRTDHFYFYLEREVDAS